VIIRRAEPADYLAGKTTRTVPPSTFRRDEFRPGQPVIIARVIRQSLLAVSVRVHPIDLKISIPVGLENHLAAVRRQIGSQILRLEFAFPMGP